MKRPSHLGTSVTSASPQAPQATQTAQAAPVPRSSAPVDAKMAKAATHAQSQFSIVIPTSPARADAPPARSNTMPTVPRTPQQPVAAAAPPEIRVDARPLTNLFVPPTSKSKGVRTCRATSISSTVQATARAHQTAPLLSALRVSGAPTCG